MKIQVLVLCVVTLRTDVSEDNNSILR